MKKLLLMLIISNNVFATNEMTNKENLYHDVSCQKVTDNDYYQIGDGDGNSIGDDIQKKTFFSSLQRCQLTLMSYFNGKLCLPYKYHSGDYHFRIFDLNLKTYKRTTHKKFDTCRSRLGEENKDSEVSCHIVVHSSKDNIYIRQDETGNNASTDNGVVPLLGMAEIFDWSSTSTYTESRHRLDFKNFNSMSNTAIPFIFGKSFADQEACQRSLEQKNNGLICHPVKSVKDTDLKYLYMAFDLDNNAYVGDKLYVYHEQCLKEIFDHDRKTFSVPIKYIENRHGFVVPRILSI